MPAPTLDLNADVGEGYDDLPLLDFVTSLNIACGGHAGDEPTMRRLLRAGHERGLALGAHPGYADRASFGRLPLGREALRDETTVSRVLSDVRSQIERLSSLARDERTPLAHVKLHGAIYNETAAYADFAARVARLLKDCAPDLACVALAGSKMIVAAHAQGLRVVEEAFADRAYLADATLAPRALAGACLTDAANVSAQALAIARGQAISTLDGAHVVVRAQTICLHGDSPSGLAFARAVRGTLEREGITVRRAV